MGIVSIHNTLDGWEGVGFSLTLETARRLGGRFLSSSIATELSCSYDEDKLMVYIESTSKTDGVDDTRSWQDELGGFLAAKLREEAGDCYDVSPLSKI